MRIYDVKSQFTFQSKYSPGHVRETLSMPGGETPKHYCKTYIKHGFYLSQILMQMCFSFPYITMRDFKAQSTIL